jgi:hypothetical protein
VSELTYIVERQPDDICEAGFTIHGAKVEKVQKALLIMAAHLFGQSPADIRQLREFLVDLKMSNWIDRNIGLQLLPQAMTDAQDEMLCERLDGGRIAQYAAGAISTDELWRSYDEELSYLVELHPNTLKLFDSSGRWMCWNDQDEMELDLREEEVDQSVLKLFGFGEELKSQILALRLKAYYNQHGMYLDGTPTDDNFEHTTYGTYSDSGEFIPVVTILDVEHPAVARRERE